MEMRLRHWIGITAVACSFIGVTSLPPDPIPPRFRLRHRPTPERAAVVRLEQQLSTAQYLLENAERRDLVMAEITAAGADDAPPFLASEEFPDGVREILEEKVRDAVGGLQLEAGPVRAVLMGHVSTAGITGRHGLNLLPRATDGRTCVTLYDLGPASIALLNDGATPQAVVDHTLRPDWRSGVTPLARGPCAFFARFGLPGPHVEAWLEKWRYSFASLADWDRAKREEVNEALVENPFAWLLRWYGLNAQACSAGRPDRCRQALMGEPVDNYYQSGRWTAVQEGGWLFRDAFSNVFGPATSHFLSDVARDVGPERFEEFWTSDLPVEQAFASVVGKDIGEWTAEWMTSRVGKSHFGPGVGFGGVLVVAFFAGLGVFAAAYVAEKRKAG